ncbi:RHS repeat-associated core domain-containing protein [Pseudomonas sp. Irchel s3f7]|uniref:RHS repeat-associated core domain-containing protein n=1 Tax=Pseudomonas sp. Irchel s3f7 TaxID=2009153 RepID=UPI000BA2D684|nr:RHS repeat-associated core domain-containing protein [Pseudomonas sp. Irchel s3f7]
MNATEKTTYRYDALDRLVELAPFGLDNVTRFYRGEHLATQLQGNGGHSVFQHGTQLLAVQSREGPSINSQLLATDQQRSVLRAGPESQTFAPYGHRRVEGGPGSLLGFTGEVIDPITGDYLLGNGLRAFNPVLMRFNSPDSLSPFGRGGLNPYAYCLGDPVNFSDPTGRFADIFRLLTSFIGFSNTRLGMSRTIPAFNLAKDALRLGAAKKLPFRQAFAAGSTVSASRLLLAASLVGVAGGVAKLAGEPEVADVLWYVGGGLSGLAFMSRVGTFWAASKPGTEAALVSFVKNKGRVVSATPLAIPRPSLVPPHRSIQSRTPSASDISQLTPSTTAPSSGDFDGVRYSWMTPEIDAALNKRGSASPRSSISSIRST